MSRARISRRSLLRSSLAIAPAASAIAAFESDVALANGRLGAAELLHEGEGSSVLLVVHLRGGADGLSVCVPYRDPVYYRARPRLAVPPPGKALHSAIDLDGRFALHLGLAPLVPFFDSGELLVVNGIGPEERTFSHLDAERELVSALPTRTASGDSLPLRGQLERSLHRIRDADALRVELACLDGWDTHVAQGADSHGRFWRLAAELAQAVAAFYLSLGDDKQRVVVAMLSERGRSLHENDTAGTDDGHAGTALVLGGQVRGGRVLGGWQSLAKISDHGSLAVTYRASELLRSLLPRAHGGET